MTHQRRQQLCGGSQGRAVRYVIRCSRTGAPSGLDYLGPPGKTIGRVYRYDWILAKKTLLCKLGPHICTGAPKKVGPALEVADVSVAGVKSARETGENFAAASAAATGLDR